MEPFHQGPWQRPVRSQENDVRMSSQASFVPVMRRQSRLTRQSSSAPSGSSCQVARWFQEKQAAAGHRAWAADLPRPHHPTTTCPGFSSFSKSKRGLCRDPGWGLSCPVQLQLDLMHEASPDSPCSEWRPAVTLGFFPTRALQGADHQTPHPRPRTALPLRKLLPVIPFLQWSCMDVRVGL